MRALLTMFFAPPELELFRCWWGAGAALSEEFKLPLCRVAREPGSPSLVQGDTRCSALGVANPLA
ncbi:MAG: hypothetical protein LM590_14110, partial [Thermofilum sp.]|nr:hypothetical protein [Thermofilum sp.]